MDADRREELKQAERRLQAAQLASDVTVLGEVLDEDAIFTGPDGNLYTREDDLRAHGTGHQVMTRVDEEDLRIATFGDDVGVTFFLGTLEGTVGGDPIKSGCATRGPGSTTTHGGASSPPMPPSSPTTLNPGNRLRCRPGGCSAG